MDVVKFLADKLDAQHMSIANEEEQTPFAVAAKKGRTAIIYILKAHGITK